MNDNRGYSSFKYGLSQFSDLFWKNSIMTIFGCLVLYVCLKLGLNLSSSHCFVLIILVEFRFIVSLFYSLSTLSLPSKPSCPGIQYNLFLWSPFKICKTFVLFNGNGLMRLGYYVVWVLTIYQ